MSYDCSSRFHRESPLYLCFQWGSVRGLKIEYECLTIKVKMNVIFFLEMGDIYVLVHMWNIGACFRVLDRLVVDLILFLFVWGFLSLFWGVSRCGREGS